MAQQIHFRVRKTFPAAPQVGLVVLMLAALLQAGAPTFVSHGRIEVEVKAGSPEAHSDFLGTQVEILQGGELSRRSLEAMRALQPNLREVEVSIRAEMVKGSPALVVYASGTDQKYTQAFLESLMLEYVGWRNELRMKAAGTAMNKVIEPVLAAEKKVKQVENDLRAAKALGQPPPEINALTTKLALVHQSYQTLTKKLSELDQLNKAPVNVAIKEHATPAEIDLR